MSDGGLIEKIVAALPRGFDRVRENGGCAGADGVSIRAFAGDVDASLFTLADEIESGTYRPIPLLRVLVAKHDGSPRQLCIPSVRDRTAQAAALEVLQPIFEAVFEDESFGYRRGRSVRNAVQRVRELHGLGYAWVVDVDIDAFFDTVPHDRLLDRVARVVRDRDVVGLIERWVRTTVWDGAALYPTSSGIPQGSVISPTLANLLLDDLDEALIAAGQRLVRYANDFVVLCKSRGEAERAAEITEEVLARLELAADELAVTSFEEGFTFLGVTFLRTLAVVPYDPPRRERRVLFMPPALDPGQLARWRLDAWADAQSADRTSGPR